MWVSICAAAIGMYVAILDGLVFGGRSWEAFRSTLLPTVLAHVGAVQPLLLFWWAAGEARLFQAQLAITCVGTALFSSVLRSQLTWLSRTVLTTPVSLLGVASACLLWRKEASACRLAHASAGACIFLLLLAFARTAGRLLLLEPASWVPSALLAMLPGQLPLGAQLGLAILAGTVIGGAVPIGACTGLANARLPPNAAAAVQRAGNLLADLHGDELNGFAGWVAKAFFFSVACFLMAAMVLAPKVGSSPGGATGTG